MSNIDSTTSDTSTTDDAPVYEKGSWQESLHKSSALRDRSDKARKTASNLLWQGAQTGIDEWIPTASDDVSGENLYNEVLTALGTSRKGDASKIKTVALAVRNNGLVLTAFPNLSKAYAEARRLTQTVALHQDEDEAADKAIEKIDAPKSTTSPEGAALILLSKGIDGAVVAILDALGANNEAAHRAFVRALSTEVAARVQAAKPKPAPKAGPKAGATQAKAGGTKSTVKAKPASAKAKPAQNQTATEGATASTKAKPAQPAAAKAKPVQPAAPADKGEAISEPVHVGDDTPDSAPVVKHRAPIRRGAKVTAS